MLKTNNPSSPQNTDLHTMQSFGLRSFSRRIGKTLSTLQKNTIEELLPKFLFSNDKINTYKEVIVEIGIGMGEHFIHQASSNPDVLYIGFEPYLNGIANSLLLAQQLNVTNILLWPDDMDLIFNEIPDHILKAIYVLFPDPWPKTKQKKRRIISIERLKLFHRKLHSAGKLYFASDIADYVEQVKNLIQTSTLFKLESNPTNQAHEGYIITKYHKKAMIEQREAQFLSGIAK